MNENLNPSPVPSKPKLHFNKKTILSIISTVVGLALVVGIIFILSHLFQNLEQKQVIQDGHLLVQGGLKSTETDLNSKIAGTIQEIKIEEGDQVEEGQVLVILDSDDLKAKVSQAKAAVNQAKAGTEQAKANVSQAQATVSQAEAGVSQANAKIDQAEASMKQAQATVKQTQSKVKQAEAAIKAAQSQCDLAAATKNYAQSQYDKAQNGARSEEINQLKIACDLAESTYNRIKELYEAGASTAHDYDQAQSSYLVAKEQYEEALNGSRPEDIAAAAASVAEAEAGIKAADSQLAQARAAKEEAESGMEQAQSGVAQAKSALTQAQSGVAQAKSSLAQAKAAQNLAASSETQAQAILAQAEAALKEAQVYLDYATIKAPTAGTVTALNIEKGELVSSGMALLTLSDLKKMWVEVNVDETNLGSISIEDQVEVSLPAFPDQTFTGTITKISQNPDFAISRATNANDDFDILSYAVKITISDLEELAVSPGMTVVVDFGQINSSEQAEENSNEENSNAENSNAENAD